MNRKRVQTLLFTALMAMGAWADTYYSEEYNGSSTDGWTSSVNGRFTPVAFYESSTNNCFLTVDQTTRNNNGAVVTGTVLADKVAARHDFTLSFDLRLGNSNNQTPVTFEVKDAANTGNIFSLAATGKNVATWTINGDSSQVVTLPGSGYSNASKAEDGSAIRGIDWVTVTISRKGTNTFVTLVNSSMGEEILPQTKVEASATGGVGNMVFTSKRYFANFAIDNITLRDWQAGDTPNTKYDVEIGGIYYDLNSRTKQAEVTSGDTKYTGSVNIPETITYNDVTYSVTAIGDDAFNLCNQLTSITIPNSVTSIGKSAFGFCYRLTSITIPNSVTSIGNNVFADCFALTSVTISNSVTSIGDGTFYGCRKLTSITIPNSVTVIGDNAFYNCKSLTSVTIPNSVTTIKFSAFQGCSGLTSVAIPDNVTYIGTFAFEGCPSLKKVELNSNAIASRSYKSGYSLKVYFGEQVTQYILGSSVTAIGDSVFYSCSNLTTVTIPNSVTSIGACAFTDCSGLTSVAIPDNVAVIESNTFQGCSGLTSVKTPNNVTSIGDNAFYECSSLKSITIPNSLTSIGDSAFYGCKGLTKVVLNSNAIASGSYSSSSSLKDVFGEQVTNYILGSSVKTIGNYAFFGCKGMTSVTFPDSLTAIGDLAFAGCSGLTSVAIPNSLTSITSHTFGGCSNLTKVELNNNAIVSRLYRSDNSLKDIFGEQVTNYILGNNVTSIGERAFSSCSKMESVTIPNSVTSIGDDAFWGCFGLTSVTIPDSVTSIGNGVFSGCSGLPSITIHGSVKSIGGKAFSGCSGLTSVTIPNSVTSIGSNAFSGCPGLTKVVLNSNAILNSGLYHDVYDGYSLKDIFGEQVTEYVLGSSVTSIGNAVFYNCSNLTSVTIANSVTSIGRWAFEKCTGLTAVTIPNSVTSIGGDAFSFCSSLTSVTIPNSVTSIGSWAFGACASLASVTIPNSVTSIEDNAFQSCPSLSRVELDNNVIASKSYDTGHSTKDIFGEQVTELIFGNCVTSIGQLAFSGYRSLLSVTIPNSVTSIRYGAFIGCSEITSVTIGDGVTSIGECAFQNCSRLTSVTIPDNVTSIGKNAFKDCSGLTKVVLNSNAVATSDSYSNDFYSLKDVFGEQVTEYVLGGSVTSIGNRAFHSCSNLTSVIIHNSVTSIGHYAFSHCTGLKSITIPSSVTSIGHFAFSDCTGLTSFTIPNSVKSIGHGAFSGCSGLTSINILNGVSSIGREAFENCLGLTSVTIPNSVLSIGGDAFSGCRSLTKVILNSNAIASESYTIYISLDKYFGGHVKEYILGGNVISIGECAFYNCSALTTVTIGSGVETIYSKAFASCKQLKDVYCLAETVPAMKDADGRNVTNAFEDCYVSYLHVPETSVSAYKATSPWSKFGNIVALDPSDIDPSQYTLVKDLDLGSYGNANNQYNLITIDTNDQRGTAWNHSNKNYPKIYNTLTPEDWHDVLAFQAVYPGSDNKGWFIYKDQGIYSKSADRSAAVLNRKAGDLIVFETTKESIEDVMTLTNGNGEADGPFTYQKSSDGKKYYVTMTGDGQVGFCSYHNGYPFITRITIYERNEEPIIIRANDLTMEYGDEVPALTWTATQDGQPVSISGEPYLHTKASSHSTPGIYAIYCEPGSVTTAGVAFANGTLTITSHTQGDVNGDAMVDVADIATVISVMAASGADPVSARNADVNHDGVVDVADIATVISIMAANARTLNIEDIRQMNEGK